MCYYLMQTNLFGTNVLEYTMYIQQYIKMLHPL